MSADDGAGARKLARIYLDDHHALLVVERELVRRMLRGTRKGAELAAFLREVLLEVEDDREAVLHRLARLGHSPSRVKSALAWTSEKAGRLKPNGRLRGSSPLTPLLELEGLRLLLESDRALWRALAATDEPGEDARARAERAESRLAEAEVFRLGAAEAVLGEGSRRL